MYKDLLEIASAWASILTAAVATIAYARYWHGQRRRMRVLEDYLREEKNRNVDEGRRSVTHLMAALSMTEAEVQHAGFQSSLVQSVPGNDERGRAVMIYFEYCGADLPPPGKF